MLVLPDDPQYCTKRRSHKGQPVPYNDKIWRKFLQFTSYTKPIQWINAVDGFLDLEVCRPGFFGVLRFSRKKKRWILQGKCIE
jgi:hypothetical protein